MDYDFNITSNIYFQKINKALENYIPKVNLYNSNLTKAMSYSLLNSGKRIRPLLTLEFCKACGENPDIAMPFACAVEMIHTYSLIHDDLPCMDNDDMRRGKPSNHIAFGEASAVLSGDALLNLAFETMLSSELAQNKDTQHLALTACKELAKSSGICGMIGGQGIDLYFENKTADLDIILDMYSKKTGAIIKSACKMGCIVAGASDKEINASEVYAQNIGLAFQIVDDILDLTANSEVLGKPVKSDIKSNKSTFVSISGIEKSKETVDALTKNAIKALDCFSGNTEFLKNLALYLKNRKN